MRPDLFAYPYGEYSLEVKTSSRKLGSLPHLARILVLPMVSTVFRTATLCDERTIWNPDRLELAINGLPLKANQIVPADVVLSENPPSTDSPCQRHGSGRQLRCFNSKYGKLDVSIIGRRAEVRMPGPMVGKRSRINCTMPGPEGRWRWFGGNSDRMINSASVVGRFIFTKFV